MLYLFGGLNNGTYSNELWRFNVLASSWVSLQSLGIKSVQRSIVTWTGEVIELQVDNKERVISDTVLYSTDGEIPTPRCSHSMVYFKGVSAQYLILFGGQAQKTVTQTYTIILGDLWVYSLSLSRWTEVFPSGAVPTARKDAKMQQLDSRRLVMFGGSNGDEFFDDMWLFNIETNTWKEWTFEPKPERRSKHSLTKVEQGLIVFGGHFAKSLNLTETDQPLSDERTYAAKCQTLLDNYKVSITDIGQTYFKDAQESFYNLTNSACFKRDKPFPTLERGYEFPSEVWVLNLTSCDCNGHGSCISGHCVCESGYYGPYCNSTSCPGSLCFSDFDFFDAESCYHCSGNGKCMDGVCDCQAGYTGDDCSTLGCSNLCSGSGNCVTLYPISQCDCNDKDGGDSCEVTFCLNNCNIPQGSCNYTTGLCTCEAEYSGSDCSVLYLT
jgi:hypothetical protein